MSAREEERGGGEENINHLGRRIQSQIFSLILCLCSILLNTSYYVPYLSWKGKKKKGV